MSLILSVVIFSLSIFPCTDAQSTENLDHIDIAGHHEHEPEHEHCSPFCICICCGINIIEVQQIEKSESHDVADFQLVFTYSFQYTFEPSNAVWQPPRA